VQIRVKNTSTSYRLSCHSRSHNPPILRVSQLGAQ